MEATKRRGIKSGAEYDHLFPDAAVDTHTIMRHAGVNDTVDYIPKVIAKTLDQTKQIAKRLKGSNDYDTCRNIWQFVYGHIAYRKDKDGYEQIRSPARSWHDRRDGVDCDCYTTFISSILTNSGIRHKLRITKYNHDYFQHIYPVAVLKDKRQVIIDCVTDQFDYEVPYSEKKDFSMDLQYLDGIDLDLEHEIHGHFDGDDLGRHKDKHHAKHKSKHSTHEAFEDFMDHGDVIPGYGVRKKKGFKKIMSFVNKVNPATLTLRNGVLASMKLNIGHAAKRLRWSYITPNEAKKKGIDMQKWKKLVQVRQKLDNIFYGAGGKPENLKKSVLKGKGNKDKGVHGLGAFAYEHDVHQMNINTPLHKLLGPEIYYAENEGIHGSEDLGDLGEPVTLATITAASGVIAAVVGMIKKVGDIFGGKGHNAADFDPNANAEAEGSIPGADGSSADKTINEDGTITKGGDKDSGDDAPDGTPGGSTGDGTNNGENNENNEDMDKTKSASKGMAVVKSGNTGVSVDKSGDGQPGAPDEDEGFWQKHKKWLLPASVGVGGIAVIAIGLHLMHGHGHPVKGKPVHGVPKRKNHHRHPKAKPKPKAKGKHHKKGKKAVALW